MGKHDEMSSNLGVPMGTPFLHKPFVSLQALPFWEASLQTFAQFKAFQSVKAILGCVYPNL